MKSRKIIAGVDEVGRGSLIGSVYSAAVILPDNGFSMELKDSKKLTEKSRIKIANFVCPTWQLEGEKILHDNKNLFL